jgi:hypothetical protein
MSEQEIIDLSYRLVFSFNGNNESQISRATQALIIEHFKKVRAREAVEDNKLVY